MNKKSMNYKIIGIIILLIIIIIGIYYCVKEPTIPENTPKLFMNNTQFCKSINENYECKQETLEFIRGETINIRTDIYIKAKNGIIKFYENTAISDLKGNMIMPYKTKDTYIHEQKVEEDKYYKIPLKDSIKTSLEDKQGIYYIHINIGNLEWEEEYEYKQLVAII